MGCPREAKRAQRIAGELTGLHLAQQAGFKQAHISNFLNRKRGLSLEGMDKVLSVQHLSVLDLLDPAEVNKHYNSLKPYPKNQLNMYAVLKNDTCAVRYVETAPHHILLRPHNQSSPVESIPWHRELPSWPRLPDRHRSLT